MLNVLAFAATPILLPIPRPVGQLVTQGILVVALMLALLANPGVALRPNIFLALLTALAVYALVVSIHNQFILGSTYRALRLLVFVAVLWVLTPWWGRPDLPLLRAHLTCLKVIIGLVWVGAALDPTAAFSTGGHRLSGAIWPMPATQVGHYSSVLFGCTVVLWLCGVVGGRGTAVTLLGSLGALLTTHTRTALLGTVIGLVVGGASLFLGHARVRRTVAVLLIGSAGAWIAFSPFIVSWLARGQSSTDLSQLTGRTKVWAAVAARQKSWTQDLFGTGLSNKSYNGAAIDSTWVSAHLELGRLGVAIIISFLLVIFLAAVTRPAGPRRAVALFLLAYCITASFTETALGDSSPYLLELAVASALLASPQVSLRRRSGAESTVAGHAADASPSGPRRTHYRWTPAAAGDVE